MMKPVSLALIILCTFTLPAFGEGESVTSFKSIQATIDKTVWRPFKTAFETLDGRALNRLYADQVLRVTPQGIDTRQQFKHTNLSRFDDNRARGDTIQLDFWFDSRHGNQEHAYEVGFYRIVITSTAGVAESHYGQFHIVLENQAGEWKIIQDWDTAMIAGKPIDEQMFQRRAPASF